MGLLCKTEEPGKGVTLVAVAGEVDLNTSPELRTALSPHIKKKQVALVVELSGVRYMDSSGIATLIEAMKNCQKFSIRFCLAAPSGPVLEVFKMAHLDKIFSMKPTIEEALKG